ncbi:MAG: hypothetical protein ISS83_01170 [Candidatus Pacebacteria bacterium]|nr:hypothetical protein [Candidatus Paceibacterota bacterium]
MLEKEPQLIKPTPEFEKNESEVLEKQQERGEKKDRIRELKDYMKKMFEELRQEGIPINEKARINMDDFRKTHGDSLVESHKARVKDLKKRFKEADIGRNLSAWAHPKEEALKGVSTGEVFEMLTTSIFHKKLRKDFIVTRTSEYDDFENNIDNIILERETGNIVCAFDEVGVNSGETFEKKKNKVSEINRYKGGANLRYGIFLEKKAGKMELKKGNINNIPLFYLSMSEEEIKNNLDNPERQEESFYNFIDSVKKQIEELKKYQVHPKLKERLDSFEEVIEKF